LSRSTLRTRAALAALACALLARGAAAQRPDGASDDSLMSKLRAGANAAVDSAAEAEPAQPGAPATLDSTIRLTGTRLKFGTSEARVRGMGVALEASKQRGRRGEQVHDAALRWFGLDASATLFFRDGALARGHVVVKPASPRDIQYVEDQLRRQSFRLMGDSEAGQREWRGATRVVFAGESDALDATIEPMPRPRPPPPPPPPALPPLPEVFVLERADVTYDVPLPEFAVRPKPAAVKKAGVMGRVWVRGAVDTAGAVLDPKIVKGIAPLDSSAIASARATRFKPYLVNGVPRAITVEFPVVFTATP